MQDTEKDAVLKEVLETLETATKRLRALLGNKPPRRRLVYDFRPNGNPNFHYEEE